MHDEKCPVCGAQSWIYLYKNTSSLDIVGCDICCQPLDEIDAYEGDVFGEDLQNHR